MQGQDDDGGADADVFGASGDRAEERPDAGEQAVAGEAVLAEPGFVEAGFVGVGDLLQSVVEGLGRREVFMVGDDGEDSRTAWGPPVGDCVTNGATVTHWDDTPHPSRALWRNPACAVNSAVPPTGATRCGGTRRARVQSGPLIVLLAKP